MVRVPLIRPYVLSYRTFTKFEPIIVEIRGADGRIGWGEGHISPGSSREMRGGGWTLCRARAAAVIGQGTDEAKANAIIAAYMAGSKSRGDYDAHCDRDAGGSSAPHHG